MKIKKSKMGSIEKEVLDKIQKNACLGNCGTKITEADKEIEDKSEFEKKIFGKTIMKEYSCRSLPFIGKV